MAITDKFRYFAFLVYEESAPLDWQKQLKDTHGDFLISPLHQPDAEQKKSHWHVIYKHPAPCRIEVAAGTIPDGIAANGHLEALRQPRNYQRYLLHLDDPDKEQFEDGSAALTIINNFPVDLSRDLSAAELREIRGRCFNIIRGNDIIEYAELVDLLIDTDDFEALDYACNHTILFNGYISSRRHSLKLMDK